MTILSPAVDVLARPWVTESRETTGNMQVVSANCHVISQMLGCQRQHLQSARQHKLLPPTCSPGGGGVVNSSHEEGRSVAS